MWPDVFVDDSIKSQNAKKLNIPAHGPVLTQKDPEMVVYISRARYNSGYPTWLTYKDKRFIYFTHNLGGPRIRVSSAWSSVKSKHNGDACVQVGLRGLQYQTGSQMGRGWHPTILCEGVPLGTTQRLHHFPTATPGDQGFNHSLRKDARLQTTSGFRRIFLI